MLTHTESALIRRSSVSALVATNGADIGGGLVGPTAREARRHYTYFANLLTLTGVYRYKYRHI